MEADELYLVPPAEFIAARDAMVRGLRAAGDGDAAAAVARRRRPSPTVWAVNRLAHDDPELVVDLLAAAADLQAAQRSNDGAAVRDVSSRLRRLVDEARRRAGELLASTGTTPSAQLQRRLDTTLQGAAVTSTDTRAALLRGRLDADVDPPGFVEPFDDTAEVAAAVASARRQPSSPVAPRRASPSAADRARNQAAVRSAETALRQLRTGLDRAVDTARRRREDAVTLRAQADAADAAADEADAQARALETQVRDAEAALARARAV